MPTDTTALTRLTVVAMVGALLMQFLLGMYINLYVTLPNPSVGGPAGMMSGMGDMMAVAFNPALWIHMLLGMLLVPLGIIQFVSASLSRLRAWAVPLAAAVGLVFVLVAGIGGVTFLMGGQHNASSFLMAVGFAGALSAYFAEMVVISQDRHPAAADPQTRSCRP